MTILSEARRGTWAMLFAALFVTATLLVSVAVPADAASRAKCRNHPENFSFFHGKCLSDKRIERIKERHRHPGEDHHHHGGHHG